MQVQVPVKHTCTGFPDVAVVVAKPRNPYPPNPIVDTFPVDPSKDTARLAVVPAVLAVSGTYTPVESRTPVPVVTKLLPVLTTIAAVELVPEVMPEKETELATPPGRIPHVPFWQV
jgi:hypothetical protein